MTAIINRPNPIKKSTLVALRSVIKGCQAGAEDIRHKEIHKLTMGDKWHAWQKKRKLGQFARVHQLAYGFLTGRAYSELEKIPGEECDACVFSDVEGLLAVLKQHAPQHFWKWTREPLTKEDVGAWISEGKPFFLTKEEFLAKQAEAKAKKVA